MITLPKKVPKKTLIVAGLLLVIYAVFGFFFLPGIVRSKLTESTVAATGQTPEVGEVSTNPFTLSLAIRDFALPDRTGERIVSFSELYINFELISIFTQAYTFSEINVSRPYLRSLVRRDGSINLMDIVPARGADSAASDEPPVPVQVDHLVVSDGTLIYEDRQRTTPFVARMDSLDLSLRDFTTRPNEEGVYQFDAKTDRGEEIRWKGSVSAVPLRSSGTLALSGFSARTVWEFLRDQVRYEITSGTMRFQADYEFDLSKDPMIFSVRSGDGQVTGLELLDPRDGTAAVSVPQLSVSGVEADVSAGSLTVGLISSAGGTAQARYLADSTLTLQTLFEPLVDPLAPVSDRPPWKVLLRRLTIEDYTIRMLDETTSPHAGLELSPFGLTVENYPYGLPGEASLVLTTGVNGDGRATVRGKYTPEPLASSLEVTLERVGLLAFQPYVNGMAAVDLRSGTLSLKGTVTQRETNSRSVQEFGGDVWVESLRATDRVLEEDFLRWKRLDLKRVRYRSDPGSMTVEEILARQAYLRAIINEDYTSNIQEILGVGLDSASVDTTTRPASRLALTIPAVRILESEIHFSDLSLTPNFIVSIQNVEGEVTGLSSVDTVHAVVALDGRVDKYAPASITGDINVLSDHPSTDLFLNFKGIELTTFSPYSGKFAGYKIDKGKMTLDLHYTLVDRYVKGENKIVLDQLTLGEEVESPDATSLPVKLAIALLKDKNGVIDLDIPVEGNLDDPEFSFFPIIIKALVNVFIKIVTSPFALLGAIFGGGEELSFVAFEPGIDTMAVDQQAKLDSLGRALTERPGLQVDIRGAVAASVDREALARRAVLRQIRSGGDTLMTSLTRKDRDGVRALYQKKYQEDPEVLLAATGGQEEPLRGEARETAILNAAFQRLVDDHMVSDADFENLARQRALAIKDHLVLASKIEEERVFLLESNLAASAENGGVRVQLSLDAP